MWCARGLGGGNVGRVVVRDHVRKCAVYGEGRIVVLVSMLALSQIVDGCVLILERLPVGLVKAWPGFVTVGADSVVAGSVAAVVQGSVDSDVRSLALGIRTCDGDVALVEMPVCQLSTWTALSIPIQLSGDFDSVGVAKHGGRGNVVRKRGQRVEEPLHRGSRRWMRGAFSYDGKRSHVPSPEHGGNDGGAPCRCE